MPVSGQARGSTLINIGLGLVSVIIFVSLAELVVRSIDLDLYYKTEAFPLNRDIDFPEVYKRDAQLFWRFRKGITTESKQFSDLTYLINAHGLRGPELTTENNGLRLLALGNSCTFGWGIAWKNTWTQLLQSGAQKFLPAGSIEVLNAGVPGYSSHQGKIYFADELIKLKPDMVLIMFGWNDHFVAGGSIRDSQQKMAGGIVLWFQNTLNRLHSYRYLRKLILSSTAKGQPARLDDTESTRRVTADEFYDNLKEIIATARQNDIEPILLVPPAASVENYFGGGYSPLHVLHQRYQEQVRKAAVYLQTPIVDLQSVFDVHRNLFDDAEADPIHFNEKGHRVAAKAIAEVIAPLINKQ